MNPLKQGYSAAVRGVAGTGILDGLHQGGRTADAYGWRRWAASLLAIHDIERMIALDLPWWNVAATREVADFLAAKDDARVFEYGSGASTAWLARRAAEVVSVEHHPDWKERIAPLLAHHHNAKMLRRDLEGSDYVDAIAESGGRFDLIVIDGRRRNDCLMRAKEYLEPGGIILFDDTGRRRYASAIANSGLRSNRHFGRSYCVPYPDYSTILYG